MKKVYPALLLILITSAVLITTSCEKSDKITGTPQDPIRSGIMVDSANALLGDVLMELINNQDVAEPGDIDLSVPYNMYLEALEAENYNPAANFGAGILEVVMMSQDTEINDYFKRTEDFFDRDDFFKVEPSPSGSSPLFGGLEINITSISLPVNAPMKLASNLGLAAATDSDVTITELQDIFVNQILPRFDRALERLNIVISHPNFVFIVTPEMQGDLYEDPVEIDLTEVYASVAALQVTVALLNQFCAYDYNISSYTGSGMLEALTPGSSFMTLHNDGRTRMSRAGQAWLAAVNNIEAGIAFLESETDSQYDDLIIIDPNDDVMRSDLDSVKAYIPRVRSLLTSSEEFEFHFMDGDDILPVSLAAMFNSPVQDLKSLIPPYSVTLDTVASDVDYYYVDSSGTAAVQVDAGGYYQWNRRIELMFGEIGEYGSETIDFASPAFEAAWESMVDRLSDKPWASLSFNFYGSLEPGLNSITYSIYYSFEEPSEWRVTPRITWQADSFSEWIFPDPSLNGIFPGMTDRRLKDILEIQGAGWEKTITLSLWD